jgi:hypothetical protein
MHANLDYLIHNWSFSVFQDEMKVYFGPGIGLGFINDFDIQLRAPGGVGYYFHSFPLEAFYEIVPYLNIDVSDPFQNTTPAYVDWGHIITYVGARWYF